MSTFQPPLASRRAESLTLATLAARGAGGSRNMMMIVGLQRAGGVLALLVPGLAVLWVGVLYAPLHHSVVPHAVAMTFGGTLVGLAHLANLRLNHGHVHDATCAH